MPRRIDRVEVSPDQGCAKQSLPERADSPGRKRPRARIGRAEDPQGGTAPKRNRPRAGLRHAALGRSGALLEKIASRGAAQGGNSTGQNCSKLEFSQIKKPLRFVFALEGEGCFGPWPLELGWDKFAEFCPQSTGLDSRTQDRALVCVSPLSDAPAPSRPPNIDAPTPTLRPSAPWRRWLRPVGRGCTPDPLPAPAPAGAPAAEAVPASLLRPRAETRARASALRRPCVQAPVRAFGTRLLNTSRRGHSGCAWHSGRPAESVRTSCEPGRAACSRAWSSWASCGRTDDASGTHSGRRA